MIGAFNTITIDGVEIFRPNDFTPVREDVYAQEITTCTGKLIADRLGWKFADMALSWDMLPEDQLDVVLGISGQFTLTFTDADGTVQSEDCICRKRPYTGTRFTCQGGAVWKDPQLEVSFINVHND